MIDAIPEFGLLHSDYNWKLLTYLDGETLSRLPLAGFQIDELADRLDWDIMSARALPGWIMVKHKNRINWRIFIMNRKPKPLIYLDQVRDKLNEHADLFLTQHDPYIKRAYYTPMFMSMFPNLVDWKWCSKHIQIGDYLLNKFWMRMTPNTVCKHQNMSEDFIRKNKNRLNWKFISMKKMSEDFMKEMYVHLDWYAIAKHQKLSLSFISKYKCYLDPYAVSRYQSLTSEFLIEHRSWLKMPIVSQYQDMSIEYLRNNIQYLRHEALLKNRNYNHQNTIQIVKVNDRLYIIDAPDINTKSNIMFCSVSTIIDPILNSQYIPSFKK